jgi:hypothetical protein
LIGAYLVQRLTSAARVTNHRLLVAILLAAFILGLTMSAAIRRGMDHAVMIGQGDQTAIAIALSDSVYNVKLGYIGLKQVFDTIQSCWNRDANRWADLEQLKKNFHDAELLNAGLRAAASLRPQTPGYLGDGSLITTYYDDIRGGGLCVTGVPPVRAESPVDALFVFHVARVQRPDFCPDVS